MFSCLCPVSSSEAKAEARRQLLGTIAAEGLMKWSDGDTEPSPAQENRVLLGKKHAEEAALQSPHLQLAPL